MLNTDLIKKNVYFVSVVTIIALLMAGPVCGEPVKTMAIVPLEMNATQDLSFLQKGLFTMLASRIADPGKVDILQRETVEKAMEQAQANPLTQGALNESKARLIGAGLNADYLLYGSLTLFGQSMSLDMFMVDVKKSTPTLSFSKQANDPGAVITELDKIASEINLKAFNRQPEQIIPKEQQYVQPAENGPAADSYASPLTNFRHLYVANGIINGIAAGDVDGDKKNDVVIIYEHAIEILKRDPAGKLIPFKRIEDGQHVDLIAVDVADINHNGTDEIFVTRVVTKSGYVVSDVLEFNKTQFVKIAKDLPWYLRAVTDNTGKKKLYAQKSGRKGPYAGRNVFQVEWANNGYDAGDVLTIPEGFSVMSMAIGDNIGGTAVEGIIYTNQDGRLNLVNENGRLEWNSEPGYGGSKLFYNFYEQDITRDMDRKGKGVFFQPRNIVLKKESDGKQKVLVIKNNESADYTFGRIRTYKSADIELMQWTEMGLASQRAAKKIPGQVTDMAVTNVDQNDKKELMVTVVKKRNNFSSKKSKSIIIAYDL